MNGIPKMTARERAYAAINGRPVDRVPVMFFRHFPNQDGDNTVGQYAAWARSTRMDMLLVQDDGYFGYPMKVTTRDVDNLKEIKVFKKDSYYISGQVDRAKRICDELGDEAAVFYCLYMPFGLIKHTFPIFFHKPYDDIMLCWREKWPIIADAIKRATETEFNMMDALKEQTDLAGLFLSCQHADINRFTPDEYRELLEPMDREVVAKMNSLYENNILHMCSWFGMPNYIEIWRDYDYKAVNWAVNVERNLSLAQGRRFFKPGSTLMGGFDNRPQSILYSGTEAEIKAFTKGLIDEAGEQGYIISSDCSVDYTLVTDEALRWVVEASEEYGRGIR